MLAKFAGYDDTLPQEDLLAAVRLRWNQSQTGPLTAKDIDVLKA